MCQVFDHVALEKWFAEGYDLTQDEVSHAMVYLRRQKMFRRVLQLS